MVPDLAELLCEVGIRKLTHREVLRSNDKLINEFTQG